MRLQPLSTIKPKLPQVQTLQSSKTTKQAKSFGRRAVETLGTLTLASSTLLTGGCFGGGGSSGVSAPPTGTTLYPTRQTANSACGGAEFVEKIDQFNYYCKGLIHNIFKKFPELEKNHQEAIVKAISNQVPDFTLNNANEKLLQLQSIDLQGTSAFIDQGDGSAIGIDLLLLNQDLMTELGLNDYSRLATEFANLQNEVPAE